MAEEQKEKFDNYKYQQQYIKENVKFLHVPFNKKFPDERKLFEYLDEHAKKTGEKKGAFVKRLIRAYMEAESVRRISVDNGHTFVEPEEAINVVGFGVIVNAMEDEARERVHAEHAPCSEVEFLKAYLAVAKDDLIIG